MDHPEASVRDLMEFIKGPDFPTAATICGISGILNRIQPGGDASLSGRAPRLRRSTTA